MGTAGRGIFFVMLALVGAVVWFGVVQTGAFGLVESTSAGMWRPVLGYLATLAGVVSGSMYRQLTELQAAGVKELPSIAGFVKRGARSVDLWLGLCVSPIVFILLLQSTAGMNTPGVVAVGLENGFCCLVLVKGMIHRKEASTT